MVSPETRAVTAREMTTDRMDRACCKRVTIMAAVEPEIMPQISPTTSLQKLETLLAFRMRPRASRAPGVRWAAMEWKGRSSAAVTATPMMSNTMPSRIKQASTTKASAMPAPSRASSEARLSTAERTTDRKNTCMAQRNRPSPFPFFSCFFLLSPVSKLSSPAFLLCSLSVCG